MRWSNPKVLEPATLASALQRIRSNWHQKHDRYPRVVQCSGCFDLVHPGHVIHLQTAKEWGDLLIVSINDDDGIRTLKGPGRPILDLQERIILLTALEAVDYVTWFTEDTPDAVIRLIKPDLYVKGDEYDPTQIPELQTVFQYGAFRPMPHTGWTTTKLIERIVERHHADIAHRLGADAQIRTESVSSRDWSSVHVSDREGGTDS